MRTDTLNHKNKAIKYYPFKSFINRFKVGLHLAKRCKVPSPADKIVLAFQDLARLAQLTEWPAKEGQPWKAQDSHCVYDELSSNLALQLHPACTQGSSPAYTLVSVLLQACMSMHTLHTHASHHRALTVLTHLLHMHTGAEARVQQLLGQLSPPVPA